MPVDHSKHKFLGDIGTDWVALSANGAPLARAHDEETVRRAAPNAAEYITSVSGEIVAVETRTAPGAEPVVTDMKHLGPVDDEPAPVVEPEAVEPEQPEPETPAPTQDPLDHDGNGRRRRGSRRQRRPAA